MTNRVRHFFLEQADAEAYANRVRASYPTSDLVCIENVNAEDKARGYDNPRINGWAVIHDTIPKYLTWDHMASIYDALIGGCPARTLPMKVVAGKLEDAGHVGVADEEDGPYYIIGGNSSAC